MNALTIIRGISRGGAPAVLLGLFMAGAVSAQAVPPADVAKIQKALPERARAKPSKPHKVLVFTRAAGYRHSSIPYGARAMQLMGEKTGAFEAIVSDDLVMFAPGNIERYDAIVMVNTTGDWIQPTEEDLPKLNDGGRLDAQAVELRLREGLLKFVGGGKGLVGFHAASDANYHWPEFGELVGGYFDGHPWHEKVAVKLDDPDHVLSSAFHGRDFMIVDEIYQFRDPYSRKRLKVLLSLDTDKTNMKKKNIHRTDGDFAVAWISRHGKGRVFYSSLGHREEIYWNPHVMQFYLDGIQFALGDLDADATPSGLAR